MEPKVAETVQRINRHELPGRLKKIRIALYEAWRHSTYIDPEQIPFTTTIPVGDIGLLKDENLRSALIRQKDDIETGKDTLTLPVATYRTRRLTHTWGIPRYPVSFDEDSNENH